jgi:hypothetical protein
VKQKSITLFYTPKITLPIDGQVVAGRKSTACAKIFDGRGLVTLISIYCGTALNLGYAAEVQELQRKYATLTIKGRVIYNNSAACPYGKAYIPLLTHSPAL